MVVHLKREGVVKALESMGWAHRKTEKSCYFTRDANRGYSAILTFRRNDKLIHVEVLKEWLAPFGLFEEFKRHYARTFYSV